MKILNYILVLIISTIPLISKSQDYCEFIQNIQNYQDSVKLKSVGDSDILDSNTFDIHTYLSFFDKIAVETGFIINVYFFDNFLDGNPYLYALKENERIVNKNKKALYKFLNKPEFRAKNHVKPKDSEIGFLQYLLFSEMGEQFALKWHSNYNEKYIICSKKELNEIVNEFRKDYQVETSEEEIEADFSVDSEELNKLEQINPTIKIESGNGYYTITWIENRTHSGIFKCTYQINKNESYNIEKIKEEKLLDIEMNIIY